MTETLIELLKGFRNRIFYFMTKCAGENKTSSYALLGELKEMLTDTIKAYGGDHTPVGEMTRERLAEKLSGVSQGEIRVGSDDEVGRVAIAINKAAWEDDGEEDSEDDKEFVRSVARAAIAAMSPKREGGEMQNNMKRFYNWGKYRGLNPGLEGEENIGSPEEYWNDALDVIEGREPKREFRNLPSEPTEAMKLAGARSIGKSMGTPNHTERASECWKAMVNSIEVQEGK